MTDRLAKLVAIDTQNPPGKEDEAAYFLAAELRDIGFDVALSEVAPGRVNVIAEYLNGPGPVLAFNSHIDVVPAGEGWSRDPLKLWEAGGRLYGRGSNDAKGQIVCMLEAARMLIATPETWSGTLMAVFVAGEEVDSIGAKAYAKTKPAIDYVIIGEPTSNAVAPAHKGSMRPIVRVTGQMAHSANPDLGVNAIFQASELLKRIEAEHEHTVRHRLHPLAGQASLTVTRINGGIADNIVPDSCEIMLDRRMVPGETDESATAEIEALLDRVNKEDGVEATIAKFQATTGGASETAIEHPIVQAALAAAKFHGVKDIGPTGFSAGCDLVHFRSTGAQGVIIGPGDISVAHKPDEFVPIDEFVTASLIHRDIVVAMLPPEKVK
ncbi:MAG: M20 family metallopeptidase [Rhodospirillales bacterium]|nr:M20 family metallopeptidase [Rhodospirillales bacterium]